MIGKLYVEYFGSYIDDDDNALLFCLVKQLEESYKKAGSELDFNDDNDNYAVTVVCNSSNMKEVVNLFNGNTFNEVLSYLNKNHLIFTKLLFERESA